MQIKKNQGKINFRIVGARISRKNLRLAIFLCSVQSTKYSPQIWSELATIKFPEHKFSIKVCLGLLLKTWN